MGRFEKKDTPKPKSGAKGIAAASQQGVAGAQRETQMGDMLKNALGKKKK